MKYNDRSQIKIHLPGYSDPSVQKSPAYDRIYEYCKVN